jgi:LCP family protein required for cell wall assembly
MADEKPNYKVYRSRPRLPGRREEDGAAGVRELREPREAPQQPRREGPRPYQHEAPAPRRRFPFRLPRRVPGTRRRVTVGRVLRWLVVAVIFWLGLSAVLFIVSAQVQRGDLASRVGPELDPGPYPLFGANTILVLGSDARTKGLAEPGSQIGGPSRSDSIMLLRVGGGANASLSIPRDTVVDIPGSGTNKINAAYAIGGARLAVRTVKQYLGIEINHVVEVSFDNFPQLIDALGGVTVRTPCVISRINGGAANGGTTLRLRPGKHELDGKEALALARTRKNECRPQEDDRTRARRQQQLVAAMKDKVRSFETFVRLPWVSWAAPRAVRSDMSGPTLLGVAAASLLGGSGTQMVLRPSGGVTLSDGGAGLIVSDAEKERAVARLLRG